MPLFGKTAKITGTQINYLFICHSKLWFFSHHLQMEHSSDLVATGKFIHENTYEREKKEIRLDEISIDFVRKGDVIELHEVKKSQKMEKAHTMQVLYYLYVLKKKGISATAVIDYPVIRQRTHIQLDELGEAEIERAILEVRSIIHLPIPPTPKRVVYCPKCAYYDLCWSE